MDVFPVLMPMSKGKEKHSITQSRFNVFVFNLMYQLTVTISISDPLQVYVSLSFVKKITKR
jgi:hypothetical protein